MAVHDLIKEYASKYQRIIFNGDGYSEEWVAEANAVDFQTLARW